MANWFKRWFDKPKPIAKTELRAPPASGVATAPAAPTVAKPVDGHAAEWKPGELILEEYRVERELGHGSMGTVYLVSRAHASEQRFAVKRVRVEGDVYRRHFLAELQTWLDLSEHPHLVACRFFRTVGDELVIFAEYVEGAALSRWIEDKKITRIETALDLAIQFAWGLHAAHEQGVIHQDVKPGNALVTADGAVKVVDFGLARAQSAAANTGADKTSDVVVAHAGGMTEEYCSPEQAQGQPLSRQSDLWSWGVSVLEMFAGRVTWRSGVLAATALEELLQDQARESTRAKGPLRMPPPVANVLHRCFRDDPRERWPTLLAAAQALVEAYRNICGTAYSRDAPAMRMGVRGAVAALDRRASGGEWPDPKAYLIDALKAAGRDPAEADALTQPSRDAHSRKVRAIDDLGAYQEAQTIFETLIAAGRSEWRGRLAELSMNQALVHRFVDDEPGAAKAYERAIVIYERLVHQEGLRGLADELAMAYVCKANTFVDRQAAADLYDRAITIYERLVHQDDRHELTRELGLAYMNKGVAISDLGDKQSAVDLYDRAIAIYGLLVVGGQREISNEVAQAFMNKAVAVSDLGDHHAALRLHDLAIKIREHLVNQEGQRKLANDLALSYLNKANTVSYLGDLQVAADLYERAINIYDRLVTQEGKREFVSDLAIASVRKAWVASGLGDHRAAVGLYDSAIAIYERLVNQEGRGIVASDLALAYRNKAISIRALGDNQATVVLFDRAIKIYERLVNQEGQRDLVGDLTLTQAFQADVLKAAGMGARARAMASIAVAVLEKEVKRTGRADLQDVLNWLRQKHADLL